jgi:hypothetical protein
MWLGLVALGFPPSVLPLVLLVGAVCVDLAVTWRLPGWSAAPATAAAVYAAGWLQDAAGLLPPWDRSWWSIALVLGSFTLLWTVVDLVARSRAYAAWLVPVEPARAAVPVAGGASAR